MSISAALTLVGTVQVARESVSYDGQGGTSTVTTLTTLGRAAIWQPGSNVSYLSGKLLTESSHVLACEVDEYAWTVDDRFVVYDGDRYRIAGRPEDVMFLGDIQVVPLRLVD